MVKGWPAFGEFNNSPEGPCVGQRPMNILFMLHVTHLMMQFNVLRPTNKDSSIEKIRKRPNLAAFGLHNGKLMNSGAV